jgi:hypothetical protein
VLENLAAATRIHVVHQATLSHGMLVSDIESTSKDDDTVEAILEEAGENDEYFAYGSVFQPPDHNEVNEDEDDDDEGPVSPAREISLRNRSVGTDRSAPARERSLRNRSV